MTATLLIRSGLIILSGLVTLFFWLLGWQILALWAYLVSLLALGVTEAISVSRVFRGIDYDAGPDAVLSSFAFQTLKDRWRVLLSATATSIGEIGCWPFRALIGGLCGALFSLAFRNLRSRTPGEMNRKLKFFVPTSITVLSAYSLQSWFMMTRFSEDVRSTEIFKLIVAIQLIFLLVFLTHFYMRKQFEKNFSSTAMRPVVFFLLSLTAVLAASVLTRQLYEATFSGGTTHVTVENSFGAFQQILNNSGLFDLIGNIRNSESLGALWHSIVSFFRRIDFIGFVDIFLGFSFVSTFGRSIWTMLTFSRDDEDRRIRCTEFLHLRDFHRVKEELDQMESDEVRAEFTALLALAGHDVDTFQFEIRQIPKSHEFRVFGDDPVVLHYMSLLGFVSVVPLSFDELCGLISDFAKLHGHRAVQAYIVIVYFFQSKFDISMITGAAEKDPAAESFLEFLMILSELLNEKAFDVLAKVKVSFPEDEHIANITLGLFLVGVSQNRDLTSEQLQRIRDGMDTLFASAKASLENSERVSTIYLAVAIQAWPIQRVHEAVFGEENKDLEDIKKLLDRALRARGLRVPKFVEVISKARVRLVAGKSRLRSRSG